MPHHDQDSGYLGMTTTFLCPRRIEAPMGVFNLPDHDDWHSNHCCSYCGSLAPHIFMQRLEEETITLVPTDKNYKVYACNRGGEGFKQLYKDDPEGELRERQTSRVKFYFQHLDEVQKQRFVELWNLQKLHIDYPGYFYVLPFFLGLRKHA